MTFTQLNARLKNFLNSWLLVLGLKECLVECATSCAKSEVILLWLTDSRMSASDTDLSVTNNVFFLKASSKYFEMFKSTWFLEVLIKQWVDLDYLANFLALRLTIWKTPKKWPTFWINLSDMVCTVLLSDVIVTLQF